MKSSTIKTIAWGGDNGNMEFNYLSRIFFMMD